MVFTVIRGDIASQRADALVNAAGTSLQMGSGVAGALRRGANGPIDEEAVSKGPRRPRRGGRHRRLRPRRRVRHPRRGHAALRRRAGDDREHPRGDEELGPDTPNMFVKLRTAPRAGRYHDRLENSRWRYHQAFFEPRFGGYRLDWCRRRAEDCGTDAASAWAEGRLFTVDRIRFAERDEDVGLTKIVGSGELCEAAGCDGFQRIALAINK